MEREGLETVHTNLGGNAVVPEGGCFLEPPSISKVPGEEICRKQIDQEPYLEEKNGKQVQKDEGFEVTEDGATKENAVVDENKQIAETDKQVDDVTGNILQMDKIEEACLNIGEEEKSVKQVEAIENREDEVDGKPKSIEKRIGGPRKYEEGERKIEESVEVETSKEVSSFEPSLSRGKEAPSQTPDATVNNLDNPVTVIEVFQENESKYSGTGDQNRTIDEQQIGEERNEGVEEKSESCSRFLDEKDTDVVEAIEKIENEKEGTTCNTIGGGTYIVEAGIDIWNEKEAIPEIGEDAHDKQNTEDIAAVAHKTQEKQTEEMYSQQVDKSDTGMVSETEFEGIVNKSPQEGQNVILEKTAEAGGREDENIEDEMNPEQKLDVLFTKHESKQSIPEDLAMAEESTEESRDMQSPTVIAVETNTSDLVPVTITPAQDHSTIADEEVVVNTAPEHSKEEISKYKDKIEENFAQKDEAENEKIENSLTLISGEINTATSSECSEEITSAKEDTPIKIPGKSFEDKKEEKPIDAKAVVDKGLPIEKGLPPTDLNEKIEDAGLELQNKNSSELHISHSLEQETMPVKDEKQPKISDFEPQEQDHEAYGPSKDLEKQIEVASEACVSMQNTNLEHPSAEGAITTEVSSKASEMDVEKEEKVYVLKSEEKLEIDDAETNLEEEMQKMEEAHDEQKYIRATSDTTEEVTSDKVRSREFVDRKVEHSVQAAGLQEEETPLKNGVEENYEISNIVNEEVIDEPKIKDIGEVIDEEKIKDDATNLSSELVFDEKMVESSQDNETEEEMSKGEYGEEQVMEDNNAKVILQESIQEASVNDFQNEGKNVEKSSREMYEVSEAAKKVQTNNNVEIPDSTPQTSLLKEQEGLQTEKLTAAAEEKDEDRSSIRKDEDEDNNNLIKDVRESSEKEVLKGEEGVEKISPKNELQENLEHSASMISAETEEIALKKMTQNTEEEIGEGVEDVKKEAEIGKEEGEEQVDDENNTKSNSIESTKEVPESIKKNAEEFKGEIVEESVTAGTNESIADATYQNDGTPNAALQTSTVKEVETLQGKSKDTTPAEASPEEEEEHDHARGLKRVEDNSSETGLEEDLEKSDGEISKKVDAVAHETNQYKEFPNSTLETLPVEEQASLQRDNLTPAETSREEKKYEEGSSNEKDEDNEKNAGETLKAEENLEQMLLSNELIENPEQSITMICAETGADSFSKMVDNHEEEIVEIPRGNAEAELLKEENTEGHVIEESNNDSLSQESAVESPIKNFQNAAKNSEKSTKVMLESQTAGGDETSQNDENYNSSLATSLAKIDESFKCEDKNITPAEASPHDEKEEHGSLDKVEDGNDSNPNLIVTNEDSAIEASKVEENFEQEIQKIEPGEPEESSTVMVAETEAGTLSDKIDDITSQEEVVTVQKIEETEEHGSLEKAGKGNDSNPDLIVINQISAREASKVEEDFEQELPKIEPGAPEESSTVMAAETEAGILSDKIDDITSQEEVVTIQNIKETEEHGSLDKAGEGNESNPDIIVINQISAREALRVEEECEQELQKVEPGEPEESSIVMAAETEAGTLSDKIDDITIQEEFVTIQNIEETEEHGSLDKADEGNDSNPDLTVINQISAREASKVEEDFEQELQKVELGEPEESSTIMAAETEAGTLSDKIDDISSQEEFVTIQNIEEIVEKEKNEEHESLDKAGEGNDSDPDLIVNNQDNRRETSKVEEDFEQELKKMEPGEPEESSTVMAAQTEACTLSDKIGENTSQEEVVTIQNIEETIDKEKEEGSEDIDVTKVKRVVMEEDLKLVAEAFDANTRVQNDVEEENILSDGKEVETVEKTFGLDSIQKLEVEEKREYKEEETKNEDIKKVCGDTKLAVTTDEHTSTDISPQTTGETTAEEKAKTEMEMEESVITSVDEDTEKKVPEEETATNDQSRIIYRGDESGTLVEQEVHEIIQTAEEDGDIGKQGSVIMDNYEVSLSGTNEENPLHKETEDESKEVKPNDEVKDSNSEFNEPFEASGSLDRQEFETLRGKQGPNSDIYIVKASEEGVPQKESNKSLIEISSLESESKEEILEEVQPDVNDSSSTPITGITRETSFKEAEPEDKRQIESFELAPQEKGPETKGKERTTLETVDIDAKLEDTSNFVENEDRGIPAASEAEELETEMHKEIPITGSEDNCKQKECSILLPKESELMTSEGNKTINENPTCDNIETPQTPQEIEIMLKEDMPIHARDASKSMDSTIECINEEVGSYQLDNLNEHHELDNEKQEGIDISKSSEVRDLANQGEICKLMSLEDKDSSNVGDEALKCTEAISAERKEVIQEEDNSTKKSEDSLTENVEANKAAFALEEGTNHQEQAIVTKDYRVLDEENFEVAESGKKLEGVSETETRDQSSEMIPEADPGKVDNITEIQNKSLESVEKSSEESQELLKETDEKTELKFEAECDAKEKQNTNETVKDVILTEEVHEEAKKASSETLKCKEKDVTWEPCAKSAEDERVHEVQEFSLIAGEYHKATESNDNVGLEPHSNLASQIPIDDQENITREQVAQETADADDLQENERASDLVYESKDHRIEELNTGKIKEENEKSSETVEYLGAEAAAKEVATDQTLPEVISKEEQGSYATERRKENMKDAEFLEDDLRTTEEVSLQRDDSRKHDISQLELQSNKDIQNQSPKEVLEEECESPDETKEEINEGSELVSIIDSQGFEALKKDENTSGQTAHEEKLEEQNQTPSVALVSKEKDRGTETMIENIEECVQVEISADPQNSSSPKITEDTCLHKEEINQLDVSGFGVELNTGTQKDSLSEIQVEASKSLDDATKLQTPEYETSKETFESVSEAHGHKGLVASEETEIKEKHPEVAITDLAAEENRSEKIVDAAEIIHYEVIEEETIEKTSNLRTEINKEASDSILEVHGLEVLAESEDIEIKEKHPEVIVTDMASEENQSERTIDAAKIINDEPTSEELTKRKNQRIMEVKEDANNGNPVTLGEETTKESQEEHELKAEESLGDKRTEKDIQNEELYKEVEKAGGNERTEKQIDTERITEHLHLAAAENETVKESFLDEAGSKLHLENQVYETASGNDDITEAANVKEEELDVEISQKEGPADLVVATRDIHEEDQTSKTTTEHIEGHAKEVEIEVDEHPPNSSAPKTTENTCSQEENKEQEVCGPGVARNTDIQRNGSNEFDEEEGKTPDEDSTLQHQGYGNKIRDKEYPPENNKMTEITETGAFEKTSNLSTGTSEEAFKSVSDVHEHEVLAESEHIEIKKEEHTEVAVTDLGAAKNQNEKTIDAAEVVHDKHTNEEFKAEKEDTKNYNPINLGEETSNESHQIYDLKAEKSREDKMAKEIQNEELSNERRSEYLHQTAVENESIKESFPDEALVKNAEEMGTKLQVENQRDEKISGYDRTEAITITNEEFGTEISEKERHQAPSEANETTQDIHQGERETDSTSEKPIPIEAEPQETIERKKDAPQVLLQEPIVEATQSAEVGESEPGNATGIVDAQGLEHRAEKNIDENNIKETDESMFAKISLFDMMQRSTRTSEVGGDLKEKKEVNESKEETRVEGEKTKSDEEKEDEEEGDEHKKTDSGSDAPVMVEASRDMVDVKVANKKHHSILSGVGSKVKHSISKVKKAITGKSSHPKQHSPR